MLLPLLSILISCILAQKKTFITDVCKSDAECTSGCCGFKTGKCAGPIIALQRDGGCGFGNASPNGDAAKAMGFTGAIPNSDSAMNAKSGDAVVNTNLSTKKTFITDVCKSDAECTSGCCGFKTGKCAGPIIALQRDGGCGFGNASPNGDAAKAMGFTGAIPNSDSAMNAKSGDAVVNTNLSTKKTFITDVCKSDAECTSGCCGFKTGKCAGPIIALQRDGGCGFGNASPNGDAAKAMGFTGAIPGSP